LVAAASVAVIVIATTRHRRSARDSRADVRPADPAFMYAIHAALRRDVERLRAASTQFHDPSEVPSTVRDGWNMFRRELTFHHQAEDEDLWPMLRARVTDEKANATIDEMVREHQGIPPALDAVDQRLAMGADLTAAVDELAACVMEHLDHEERAALPLVERHLTDAEWHGFLDTERRKRTPRERPVFLTWVLDDASPADTDAVLREVPRPGRLVYRHVLRPRYEARRLWSSDPDRSHHAAARSDGRRSSDAFAPTTS
jgi:hypothetical protein